MRGDLLDLALIVLAAAFAVSGYRQGFIVGSLSFIGFVGGAVLGAEFGPSISRAIVGGQTQQDVVAVVLLVCAAIIGQFIASSIGAAVRQTVTSPSSTILDSIGGAAVSVLSMLLIAWAIGSVLTASSFPVVVGQVDNSVVLSTMDRIMPSQAKTMFGDFRRLLSSGPFPQVFSGIGAAHLFAVAAPDPAVLNSPGYLAARSRVVKVQGTAPSCDRSIEGSGFVYAPQHVLTNAHVVAGVQRRADGDHGQRDDVPRPGRALRPAGGRGRALRAGAEPGPAAASTTRPRRGRRRWWRATRSTTRSPQVPARIGGTQNAVGPDIYQTGTVQRQIFEIRAVVEPGNSGGPLLSPSGTVYGVVFAAAVNMQGTGFALTASEVAADANAGAEPDQPDVHPGLRLGLAQGQPEVGLGQRGEAVAIDAAARRSALAAT